MLRKAAKTTGLVGGASFTYWNFFVKGVPHKADLLRPATIGCKCGEVSVTFRGNARLSLECACSDCMLRGEWSIKSGCPLTEEEKIVKPVHAYYFGNAITSVKGQENLKTYKLRSDALCTMSVAECCKSILMIDNPAYRG